MIDALDAYARLAAHQLGEALCLIKGYAALIGDADGDGDAAVAGGLNGGAERVQRFVDDLFDVIVAGTAEIPDERVELGEALQSAAASLDAHLREPGVRLAAGPLPAARGSRVLLERLFGHLLRGALAARAERPLVIAVAGREGTDLVSVGVADTGRALDGDTAAAAFEPFARGRGRGPLVGAGVGLSVCARIVARHRGTIAAEPVPGGGVAIVFTLPRAP